MSTVKQILNKKGNEVFATTPDKQAIDALKIMDQKGIGVLVIVENDKIKGLFTEGDYISRVLLKDISQDTPVDDVMTKNIKTIQADKTVNETMQLMIDKDIRYLPITDNGKLAGIISMGDCVNEVISEQEEIIEHLEHYIHS